MLLESRKDVEKIAERVCKGLEQQKVRAMVCAGTGCLANGSLKVYEKLRELVAEKGLLVDLDMTEDACGDAAQCPYRVAGPMTATRLTVILTPLAKWILLMVLNRFLKMVSG